MSFAVSNMRIYGVLFLFTVCKVAVNAHHFFIDKKQAEFFKNEVDSYALVTPRKVTSSGELISHDVRHHTRSRARRSTTNVDHDDDNETVHYHIPLSGNELLLKVIPNHRVLAPGFVVERHGASKSGWKNRTRSISRLQRHCLFHGEVNGTGNSHVALSTCYGLKGVIRTGDEDYFIEPVKGSEPNELRSLPHVLYRRSAVKSMNIYGTSGTCGNSGEISEAIKEREEIEKQESQEEFEKKTRRKKRSVSVERNVETLVVADKMMTDYYSDEDIETYILTVMNVVSTLYHDASIGNAINIVLVRLMLLENEEEEENDELMISQHADNTLKSFCKWQKFINPKDEDHPNHHDVAILLTRYNICTKTNEPCSTLGLAEVAGMCQPHRSCNVNEDTGLALAYTIAHEMGHNFGMSHDGPHNGCQAPFGERQHVMSPHLNSDASPFVWSNCSRSEITKFLDRDWGSCLDDEPSDHEFSFPELPPGAMYDADHQCRLQYGPDAGYCEGIEDVCQTLWCRQDNKCVTRLEPAAEGTLCDRNMWCYMGKCTVIGERPESIDGEWGPWSSWSECSRTCGAGVMHSERHCDNPSPAWGGRFCIGERRRYKICNTKKCPEDAPSFRALQCQRFNDVPYKDELHSWLPISTPMTPCQLHCKPEGQFFSVMLSDTVEDGTECNPGTRDVCINGKCRRVSCDWAIDSSAQEDRCGICHGDGTQCLTIKGKFDLKVGLGYVEVVKVPKGARNIRVEELVEATNYIAVQSEKGEFFLNGQWFIQWTGEYKAAGTTLYYQRDGEKETLHAPGPIKEELRILLLYQTENPGIVYEYTIPNINATRKPEFHWEYTDWTVCSTTCGGGMQVSKAKCFEKEAGLVEEKYCNKTEKPADMTRICNKHQCPAKWWTGPWQHCSVTCGENGIRRRTVICVRSLGPDEQIALLDEDCDADDRPVDHEQCHKKQPCRKDASWDTGQWTEVCSDDPCNYQSRHVYCSHPSGKCEENVKPTARRQCGNITCGTWVVGNWTQCSTTCGEGTRERTVSCRGGLICHKATEPTTKEKCHMPCSGTDTRSSAEDSDNIDNFLFPDISDNLISNDIEDTLDSKKNSHPHKHGGKISKSTWNKKKKSGRPREIATDVINHQIYEAEDPVNKDHDYGDLTAMNEVEEVRKGSIIRGPDDDFHIFEDGDTGSEHHGHKYTWKVSTWTKCSEPCDGGRKRREAMCLDMVTKHMVVDELCDPNTKPETEESCNTEPCLEWVISEWGQCSEPCGEGVMRREVHCPRKNMCNHHTKPPATMPCFTRPCLDWVNGPWSRCSVSCGKGVQIRHIKCVNLTSQGPANGCDTQHKPDHRQMCNLSPCPTSSSAFSQCEDKMEAAVCKSFRHMCTTVYFKTKCCATCSKQHHFRHMKANRKGGQHRSYAT